MASKAEITGLPAPLPHLGERWNAVSARPIRERGEFVLCWLHHAIRDHENPALDTARWIGHTLDRPVLVYQGLGGRHPFNSDRHHTFITQGARDLARGLADLNIAFAFHAPTDPAAPSPLRRLVARSCVVVTEDFPAPPFPRWTAALAARASCPVLAVDSACVLPFRHLGTRFTRAFAFRDAAARAWRERVGNAWPAMPPGRVERAGRVDPGFDTIDPLTVDIPGLCARCEIDHSVPPVAPTEGGSCAGYARWDAFKARGLRSYDRRRNDALDADGVSRLSPYLHHGHVSPFRVAREAAGIGGPGAEKFLDELLVWRELAFNFCAHTDEATLTTPRALPDWAQRTLADAAGDRRESIHSWETLARGRTGDALWDAAQASLVRMGELHNNVRMTWGKAVLGWTRDADAALDALLDLNHRFALDGSDPNSYAGLLWCLGLFDRPFQPPRPVYGTVRARETAVHAERLPPRTFRAAVAARARHAPLRVAIVGGGVAGLTAARTLADHGVSVTVIDKGRGYGGRLSTRRVERAEHGSISFDHGTTGFELRDPRLVRAAESWVDDGVAAWWTPTRVVLSAAGGIDDAPSTPVLIGVPGMRAICAHLGRDVDVRFGRSVVGVDRDSDGWSLTLDDRSTLEGFDRVILAVPAAQIDAMLPHAAASLRHAARRIVHAPCWTVMLATRGRGHEAPCVISSECGPVETIVQDSAKPGRKAGPDTAWVVHARPEWSTEHLERSPADVLGMLLAEARLLLAGFTGGTDVTHASAHRWRYATVVRGHPDRCVVCDDSGLVACGEGFGGRGVESALLSGQAAAARVLTTRTYLGEQAADPSLFGDGRA